MRQGDRRVVGDLELHRDHGRDPLLHQLLGRTGEGVGDVGAGALARVQPDEPERPVVVQGDAELLGRYLDQFPLAVLEDEQAAPLGA